MAWRIDRDYISGADEATEVGRASVEPLSDAPQYRFRLRDDDDEVYYGGVFDMSHGDGDGADWESSPYGALKWSESYAGCTDFQCRAEDAEASRLYPGAVERFGRGAWVSIFG